MWIVRLMYNYNSPCCGEKRVYEAITAFKFDTFEKAMEFYFNNKNKYGSKQSMGQYLEEPQELCRYE